MINRLKEVCEVDRRSLKRFSWIMVVPYGVVVELTSILTLAIHARDKCFGVVLVAKCQGN